MINAFHHLTKDCAKTAEDNSYSGEIYLEREFFDKIADSNRKPEEIDLERGIDYFKAIYKSSTPKLLQVLASYHPKLLPTILDGYQNTVSDCEILTNIETQFVLIVGLKCQELDRQLRWHIV